MDNYVDSVDSVEIDAEASICGDLKRGGAGNEDKWVWERGSETRWELGRDDMWNDVRKNGEVIKNRWCVD